MTPLLLALRPFLPQIGIVFAAFVAGCTVVGYVQELRVHSLENKLTASEQSKLQIVLDMKAKTLAATARADKINQEMNDAIPKYVASLHEYYRRNPVIRLLPPAVGVGQTYALPPVAGSTGSGPADPIPASEAGPLTPDEQRRAIAALEACGETTLLFVQCRNWAREQRRQSLGDSP